MFITRTGLYVGAYFTTLIAVALLMRAKRQRTRIFAVSLIVFVFLDFLMAYYIVDFGQVPIESFQGRVIGNFYLPWVTLRIPGAIPLGVDEIVETHGEVLATIGYFFSLFFWAGLVTALHRVVARVLVKVLKKTYNKQAQRSFACWLTPLSSLLR